jgi:hypothetical protein
MIEVMRKLGLVFVVLAGCAGSGEGTIRLDCFNGATCDSGALGVGGVLWFDLYQDGEIASGARLVSADDGVAAIRHLDEVDLTEIVGVAPGNTELIMLDEQGNDVAELPIVVQPVTEVRFDAGVTAINGPFVDPQHNAAYGVPAGARFAVTLDPFVGPARSIGTHYFEASLDGERYDACFDLYCQGPTFYDGIPFQLDAGEHVLDLHSLDGGRDFSYTLSAR